MFISDQICFVELGKTGCSYIRNVLDQNIKFGKLTKIHDQISNDDVRLRCFEAPGERLSTWLLRHDPAPHIAASHAPYDIETHLSFRRVAFSRRRRNQLSGHRVPDQS